MMIKRRVTWVLRGILIGIIGATVFGALVMALWNWLMPAVFGLHMISFWQALGLLILSRVFFGGFRGRPGWKRFERMTPEQREQFRQGMKSGRCGRFEGPAEASVS